MLGQSRTLLLLSLLSSLFWGSGDGAEGELQAVPLFLLGWPEHAGVSGLLSVARTGMCFPLRKGLCLLVIGFSVAMRQACSLLALPVRGNTGGRGGTGLLPGKG